MFWPHVIMARGFLRRHWPLWTLHTVLVSALVFVSAIAAAIAVNTRMNIDAVAQEVAIDIALCDGVFGEQIDELTALLRRRPDVVKCVHLDRQDVWQMFQSDVGLDPDSSSNWMAEIAALPEVVRVHLRSEYVTRHHVEDVVRSLRRRMDDRIEQVMVPGPAIDMVESDNRAHSNGSAGGAAIAVLFTMACAIITGRSIRGHNHRLIATRNGRTTAWLRIGPFACMTFGTVVGMLLGGLCVWFLPGLLGASPSDFRMMSVAGAGSAAAFLIILVHAALVFAPSARPRGWQ